MRETVIICDICFKQLKDADSHCGWNMKPLKIQTKKKNFYTGVFVEDVTDDYNEKLYSPADVCSECRLKIVKKLIKHFSQKKGKRNEK